MQQKRKIYTFEDPSNLLFNMLKKLFNLNNRGGENTANIQTKAALQKCS